MKCSCCGNEMFSTITTFTVVKRKDVYVVENVPCYECTVCGHISFEQETTKRLERITSGEIVYFSHCRAWCFDWSDKIIEVNGDNLPSSLSDTPINVSMTGTTFI